jgi:TonB family protein
MLAQLLALLAAAAPAAAPAQPGNTVSGVTVSPPPKTGPIAATVDMASDESAGGDFTAIWPATAYFKGGDGKVTLSCLIDVHGLAERCVVAAESPKGQGFGKAALEMRPTFQLKPATGADGQPVNATMSIKISFKPPKKDLVGVQATQAEIRSFHDIDGLINSKQSQAGNALQMRKVTMLDDPVWLTAASFDDLARAYPAKGGGVEGYAAAHCQVVRSGAEAGSLKACQVIKESPDGHDFGKAALSLAGKFHLAPSVLAGAPNHNEVWVDIPIRLPPPTALGDRTVMAPVWVLGVDPKATPRVFPPEAAEAGLTTGRGVARCTVGPNGVMQSCAPEPGEPDGLGFSEAAAKLASGMKMNLWAADAAPVVGGVVHIPIRLNLKGG